jgi:predicted TIM-barrel fold metal-dependent hydrolase
MIDTNVHLSLWPFRRVPGDDVPALVALLTAAGVTQAWAGTFDALLHRDLSAANRRVAEDCAAFGDGRLRPVGSINPSLPDWQEDLRRCVELHGMQIIRLYPNYHGYALDDPKFAAVLDAAAERRLVVQLAVQMEDERTHHPLLKVPPVDLRPLTAVISARPGLRLVLLNAGALLRGNAIAQVVEAGQVYVDVATLEGVAGIERLSKVIPYQRIVFGSHAPFFNHRAAVLKLHESDIAEPVRRAIAVENAAKLLEP